MEKKDRDDLLTNKLISELKKSLKFVIIMAVAINPS